MTTSSSVVAMVNLSKDECGVVVCWWWWWWLFVMVVTNAATKDSLTDQSVYYLFTTKKEVALVRVADDHFGRAGAHAYGVGEN